MEQKINIAEMLKDCPKGMELDCVMHEDVYFDYVDELNIIHCYIQCENYKTSITFNQHGTPNSNTKSKCVIFPKGKTTWDGFQKPFKDGDIVATFSGTWIGITMGGVPRKYIQTYCVITSKNTFEAYFDTKEAWCFDRLATEEEKERLFQAIKDNGYRWNAETKTLEKLVEPKFKVGDRIKHKEKTRWVCTIARVEDRYYIDGHPMCYTLPFNKQNEYELVQNKFDITTLKPFDKVLYRKQDKDTWFNGFYCFYRNNGHFVNSAVLAKQCIPYEGNEHLLGTTNDCDDFYKTW